MAARLHPRHSDMVRAKIQASALVTRLSKHAAGKVKMTPTQIKAAEILLDRSVPKLAQIQHTGEGGGEIVFKVAHQLAGVV